MFKKLVLGFMATSLALVIGVQAFAQKSTEDILNIYSQELFSPLKFDVNTNDTLNLRVNNTSNQSVIFEVPLMDISVEVDKNAKVVVPISFTNPADKDIWFIIKMAAGNNKTGIFKVMDYKVYQPTSDVDRINTSVLKDIINYNKTFYYAEKPEPVYNTTSSDSYKSVEEPIYSEPDPAPASKAGGYVRGYW